MEIDQDKFIHDPYDAIQAKWLALKSNQKHFGKLDDKISNRERIEKYHTSIIEISRYRDYTPAISEFAEGHPDLKVLYLASNMRQEQIFRVNYIVTGTLRNIESSVMLTNSLRGTHFGFDAVFIDMQNMIWMTPKKKKEVYDWIADNIILRNHESNIFFIGR